MQLSLAQGREREVEDLNPLEVEVFGGVTSHDTTLLPPNPQAAQVHGDGPREFPWVPEGTQFTTKPYR